MNMNFYLLALFLTVPTFAAHRDSEGLTPLHRAAGTGNVKKLEGLLNSGADLFAIDSKMGVSVLHKAVYSGNPKAVEILLKHGALVNLQSPSNGDTPLHDAIYFKQGSDLSLIKTILSFKPSLSIRNRAGLTPIESAKLLKDSEIVAVLEKYEFDRQSPKSRELMDATKANDREKVKTLLEKGKMDLSIADEQGFTPLLWAAREGFAEIVVELLKYKADPNQNDQWMGANSGHKAGFWGRTEVMEILVKGGLNINARGGYNGYTALHDAVARNHFETASVLVKARAKTNIQGHDGKTALDLAKANGNSKIIELLKSR